MDIAPDITDTNTFLIKYKGSSTEESVDKFEEESQQQFDLEKSKHEDTSNSLDKGVSRVRSNPNAPSVIPDDNKRLNNYGYLSFFILLYAAFNLLVTLVILAIKK